MLSYSLNPPSVPASKLQLFLSKVFNPSEPQFPHLENGENVVLPPAGGSQESREISAKKGKIGPGTWQAMKE